MQPARLAEHEVLLINLMQIDSCHSFECGTADPNGSLGCVLCGAISTWFYQDGNRCFLKCERCDLVFVAPQSLLSRAEERLHYDFHQNDPADPRYRRFLNRIFEPMNRRLLQRQRGLDFGSGPGPTLSLMFTEVGHTMQIYDPFYATDQSVLQGKYDFITASEVVEHFHHPGDELKRLWSLLEVDGWLGMMTKRRIASDSFATWHYRLDPTHVSFFSLKTFSWLANALQAEWSVEGPDVVLFRRICQHSPPNWLESVAN